MNRRLTQGLLICCTAFLLLISVGTFLIVRKEFPEGKFWSNVNTEAGASSAVPDNVLESIFAIEVYDASNCKIANASGFVMGTPQMLVTCLHALDQMSFAVCTAENGMNFRIDEIAARDETSDIAVCRIPENVETTGLKAADEKLRRGEEVTAVGTQFGLLNVVTRGNASMVKDQFILFTAPVSAGASGGALLNSSYEVCGVIRGTYTEGQNINTAVPIEAVEKLVDLMEETDDMWGKP